MKKLTVILILSLIGFLPYSALAHRSNKLPSPVTDADFFNHGVFNANKVELGRLLFFDKIISGNQNISCATCHHPFTGTADGLSLSVGEGAVGVSVTRNTGLTPNPVLERVPRNAPAIFNEGAKEFTTMFHDGRVSVNPGVPSGFDSPAGTSLPLGLENVLAAQAMFPVTSSTEMAGHPGENTVADAVHVGNLAGPGGVWEQLAQRVAAIPEYVTLFQAAYSDVQGAGDISFVHIANAIAAFEASAWRADNSPFDQFLRGNHKAMSRQAKRGMRLFYGKLGCSKCHSGVFQTDHDFHAIGMPQIGPGKGDNAPGYNDGHDDFGREHVTLNEDDRYKFRTPSLRNVELTGPYGHAGAYNTLEAVLLHHLYPRDSLLNYDPSQAVLPSRPDLDALDFKVMDDPARVEEIALSIELRDKVTKEKDFYDLLAFLRALTDPRMIDLRRDVPARLPSGLPVYD